MIDVLEIDNRNLSKYLNVLLIQDFARKLCDELILSMPNLQLICLFPIKSDFYFIIKHEAMRPEWMPSLRAEK